MIATHDPVAEIVSRLGAKKVGAEYMALCPAHDDRRPSLSIAQGDDGKALVVCRAGCTQDAVLAALRAMGIEPSDLFPPRSNGFACKSSDGHAGPRVYDTLDAAANAVANGRNIERIYHYSDRFAVVRFEPKDFRPVSRNGAGWVVKAPTESRPLYQVADLAGDSVFIAEGERCVEAARSIGLPTTTSSGGSKAAAKTDWTPLKGKHVILLPDNDDPGRSYADAVAAILAGVAASVRIVTLPDLPKGGDIVEFIEARDSQTAKEIADEIRALAEAAAPVELQAPAPETEAEPARALRVIRAADITPRRVDWLWPARIPIGKLTVLAGDPKTGKSMLTCDIAARVGSGARWPDQVDGERPEPARVLMLSAEDDAADTIVPRLMAAGADLSRVDIVRGTAQPQTDDVQFFAIESDTRHLRHHLQQHTDCRLVLIDPISAYLASTDSHKNSEVRRALAPLAAMAAELRVAVVAVSHRPKQASTKAIYSVMGSLGFTAAARAVWLVARDPDDKRRRLMLNAGTNLSADAGGLAYTIEPSITDPEIGVVAWEDNAVDMSADDALAAEQKRTDPQTAKAEAADWLRDQLATGPAKATDLIADASDNGISKPTLIRAKKDLGVVSVAIRGKGGKILGHTWTLAETAPETVEYAK